MGAVRNGVNAAGYAEMTLDNGNPDAPHVAVVVAMTVM